MSRKARDVARALTQKGFAEEKKRDHQYYFYYQNQKKTSVYTKISHGETDIGAALLSRMARQVRLSKIEFDDLIDCPLDAPGYLSALIAKAVLQPDRDTNGS